MSGVPAAASLEQDYNAARLAWLSSLCAADLSNVEATLTRVIDESKRGTKTTRDPEYRSVRDSARQRLVLLLIQAGRDNEANRLLSKAGYVARLSSAVLNYPVAASARPTAVEDADDGAISSSHVPDERPPLIVCDGLLPPVVLAALDRNFRDVDAPYWTAHSYAVEPPSPYFSYVVPVEAAAPSGALGAFGAVIRAALNALSIHAGAERAKQARFAELWAHNRPHPSGHQMHFDSDDEGRGGVRNPIASCVVYLTTGVGGPTLVTTQRLKDTELAARGWLGFPKRGRMVMFDGDTLHGVIPGAGVGPQPSPDDAEESPMDTRRVTVMVALWEDLRVRDEPGPGSSRPLPDAGSSIWVDQLIATVPQDDVAEAPSVDIAMPSLVQPVWTDLDGNPWPAGKRMPPYEKAFQGF